MEELSHQLVVRRGPKPGEVFLLSLPTVIVGRDPMSDVVINDPEVSRNHCRLARIDDEGYEIQDMGSTNGTFVDGKRLRGEPLPMRDGNTITLGSNVTLVYQVTAGADPMATVLSESTSEAEDAPLFPPERTGRMPAFEEGEEMDEAYDSDLPATDALKPQAGDKASFDALPSFDDDSFPAGQSEAAAEDTPEESGVLGEQLPPPPLPPLPAPGDGEGAGENNTRRYIIIAAIVLLVLCCCCLLLALVILYLGDGVYWTVEWIFKAGLLPDVVSDPQALTL